MRVYPLALALLAAGSSAPLMAQRPADRRCQLEVLSSEREGVREDFQAGVNYFLGGDVHLKCRSQNVYLDADSVASYNGTIVRFITRAHYRDADSDITADTMTYVTATERLELRGNVVAINRVNGSTLRSPWVDYLRAVTGVRDSAEAIALQRPTVTYPPRGTGDSAGAEPYRMTSDGMRTRGSSWMVGWGEVEVDRDSLHGRGDSLIYVRTEQDRVTLVGVPATLIRSGSDSFAVEGSLVHLGLVGEDLRQVQAEGQGIVSNRIGTVTGDSVDLAFEDGQLVRTQSWVQSSPEATVMANGFDVRGDSIAIDTPGERLRELRVFRRAVLVEPVADSAVGSDSLPPIHNTMTGAAIHARFVDHDSAGTLVTRLQDITTTGSATALFSRMVTRNGEASPTINYTRGDTIIVEMTVGDSSGVKEVRAYRGQTPVDGVQLERASLPARSATTPPPPAPPRREDQL